MIRMIGIVNDVMMMVINCLGVLMGDLWGVLFMFVLFL